MDLEARREYKGITTKEDPRVWTKDANKTFSGVA